MNRTLFNLNAFSRGGLRCFLASLLLLAMPALAQVCKEAGEIDPAARSAIEGTAKNLQQMSARGDVAGLRAASIPGLAGSFDGVQQAVLDNQQGLNGSVAVRKTYLLEEPSSGGERANCGGRSCGKGKGGGIGSAFGREEEIGECVSSRRRK